MKLVLVNKIVVYKADDVEAFDDCLKIHYNGETQTVLDLTADDVEIVTVDGRTIPDALLGQTHRYVNNEFVDNAKYVAPE